MSRPATDVAPERPFLMHIAAANLVTGLGDDANTTAAAWTAQRRCFRNVEHEGKKLYTAPAIDVTRGHQGVPRIHALLDKVARPLAQTLKQRPQTHNAPYTSQCLLLLPDWIDPPDQRQLAGLLQGLLSDHAPSPIEVTCWTDTGPLASHRALRHIMSPHREGDSKHHSGHPRRIVLVAVDSLCDDAILLRDHALGLVGYAKAGDTPASQAGTAGEAAAALVLDTAHNIRHLPVNAMALHLPTLSEPALSPRWPSNQTGDGQSFSQAVGRALAQAGMSPDSVGHYIDDNEDQMWRTEDRLQGLDRLVQALQDAEWTARDMGGADRLGQLGIATGAVHWALAATLQRQRLERINTLLSCSQHRNGACAAVALERRA